VSLPLFHTGGLSILARSFIGNYSSIRTMAWEPLKWHKEVQDRQITLSSLVPTQVYDLVKCNLQAPTRLRAVVVGGSNLSFDLYKKARALNWPLLPSYGLTEASSQVATAELSSLKKTICNLSLKILSHMQIKAHKNDLWIKSPSLLKFYFDLKTKKLYDPKENLWFKTDDNGEKKGDYLYIRGKRGDRIKILGETVDIKPLSELIESLSFDSSYHYNLLVTSHQRKGYELNLVTNSFDLKEIYEIQTRFNTKVGSYEKLQKVYCLPQINTDTLSKIKTDTLYKQLGL